MSEVVVDWDSVSATHAKIFISSDGKVILHDIHSAGGTYLLDEWGDKKKVEKDVTLEDGQKFSIGEDVCTFQVKYSEAQNSSVAQKTKTEFKTLTFPNTSKGQQEKVRALQKASEEGWVVVSETIKEGEFHGGTACCLALIAWPCAFLAGSSAGEINVTLKREIPA
jgi:hypothetical protein